MVSTRFHPMFCIISIYSHEISLSITFLVYFSTSLVILPTVCIFSGQRYQSRLSLRLFPLAARQFGGVHSSAVGVKTGRPGAVGFYSS
jgi:hypothetical protein